MKSDLYKQYRSTKKFISSVLSGSLACVVYHIIKNKITRTIAPMYVKN